MLKYYEIGFEVTLRYIKLMQATFLFGQDVEVIVQPWLMVDETPIKHKNDG